MTPMNGPSFGLGRAGPSGSRGARGGQDLASATATDPVLPADLALRDLVDQHLRRISVHCSMSLRTFLPSTGPRSGAKPEDETRWPQGWSGVLVFDARFRSRVLSFSMRVYTTPRADRIAVLHLRTRGEYRL